MMASAFVLLLAAACKDDKQAPMLAVNPGKLTFGKEGGEATFEVLSDSKWSVTNGKTAWYDSDKSAGEKDATVKVTVNASEQATGRKDTIFLSAGVTTAHVVIEQLPSYEDITLFVPDQKLKEAIIALFDKDKNGKVSSAEVNNVKDADFSGKQIVSIDGLEYFPALETLNLSNNALDTLDLAKVPFLTTLNCSDNALTTLNLAPLTALETLNLSDNALTTLDLSPLTTLETLNLNGNEAWEGTSINISTNTHLTNIDLAGTGIVYVNVWSGFALDGFTHQPAELRFRGATPASISAVPTPIIFEWDDSNEETALTITSNIDWTITGESSWFTLSGTSGHDNGSVTVTLNSTNDSYEERAVTLTLSGDGQSTTVVVKQNGKPLPPMEVNKTRIENGASTGTVSFTVLSNNPYTISKPEEDTWYTIDKTAGAGETTVTVTFEANAANWARLSYIDVLDDTGPVYYGTEIKAIKRLLVRQESGVTPQDDDLLSAYLPDANFYAALKAISAIPKNGAGEITVGAAKAFSGNITSSNLSNKNIASFVGIELFENLPQFYPGTTNANTAHNTAKVIDLSKNTKMARVNANRMTELCLLDVSGCPELTEFQANYTLLVELDFTPNPLLVSLYCSGGSYLTGADDNGQIRKVNLKGCPALKTLQLSCHLLTELDLSLNPALAAAVYLRNNFLSTLDISHLMDITTIDVKNNCLESLILPVRDNTKDLAVKIDNDGNPTKKQNNKITVLDASRCFSIYSISWTGQKTLQKIRIPKVRNRANPSMSPALNAYVSEGLPAVILEEVEFPAAASL
ncbi:MAG: hypothetical protein LBP56_08400 [Odoribacteraceae bacterium]|jgi:hypothetical protein|nr:hypothetical protein [Odoribacteraceae bacterium]